MEAHNKMYSGHFLAILVASILLLFMPCAQQASAAKVPKVYVNYIKSSCNDTTYPTLCVKTLSPYAFRVKTSALRICKVALSVAIKAATNASNTVSKMAKQEGITRTEAAAIKDCIDDMKDAVYELKQTVEAMGHLGDADREFQWANAKTWASAAITDADSCMDGFSGRKVSASVKNKIRSSIVNVERLTSNALYLINHLY